MKNYSSIILSVIIALNSSCIQAQVITTFAGNGLTTKNTPGSYSGDGGLATAAGLFYPSGVAVDYNENVFIADNGNNRIRKVNSSGIISTFAGNGTMGFTGDGGPAIAAELNGPSGIAVDANGNIYFADGGNNVIRKIDTFGIISTIAGNNIQGYSGNGGPATAAELNSPGALTIDSKGNIYFGDVGNHVYRKIDAFGVITTIAGNGAIGYTYSGDGGPATAIELTLYGLDGITVDNSENVYIANGDYETIRIINKAGIINTFAGNGIPENSGDGGPATAAGFAMPYGIFVDNNGNVYITDFVANQIRKVNTAGLISTIVASPGETGGANACGFGGDGGPAYFGLLCKPVAGVVDNSGNIYIAEQFGNRIRKIRPSGLSVNNIPAIVESIKIVPNPTTGSFTLQLPQTNNAAIITITDMLGSIIETRNTESTQPQNVNFNLHAPPGTYIVKVTTGENTYREKIEVW